MRWWTTEEMAKDLGLHSDPSDLRAIESELRERLKTVHPDLTEGAFRSDEEARTFYDTVEAIHFLDQGGATGSSALVPVDTVSELIKSFNSALNQIGSNSRSLTDDVEERTARAVSQRQLLISRKIKIPRISLAAITAILVFLLAFPEQLKGNPFVSDSVFRNPRIALLWWLSAVGVVVLWFYTWRREDAAKDKLVHLYSLDVHRRALAALHEQADIFSRTQLRDALYRIVREEDRSFKMYLETPTVFRGFVAMVFVLSGTWHPFIEKSAYDEATDLAIERYLQRQWIERASGSTLDDWYLIKVQRQSRGMTVERLQP